jgi:hypothetical protein
METPQGEMETPQGEMETPQGEMETPQAAERVQKSPKNAIPEMLEESGGAALRLGTSIGREKRGGGGGAGGVIETPQPAESNSQTPGHEPVKMRSVRSGTALKDVAQSSVKALFCSEADSQPTSLPGDPGTRRVDISKLAAVDVSDGGRGEGFGGRGEGFGGRQIELSPRDGEGRGIGEGKENVHERELLKSPRFPPPKITSPALKAAGTRHADSETPTPQLLFVTPGSRKSSPHTRNPCGKADEQKPALASQKSPLRMGATAEANSHDGESLPERIEQQLEPRGRGMAGSANTQTPLQPETKYSSGAPSRINSIILTPTAVTPYGGKPNYQAQRKTPLNSTRPNKPPLAAPKTPPADEERVDLSIPGILHPEAAGGPADRDGIAPSGGPRPANLSADTTARPARGGGVTPTGRPPLADAGPHIDEQSESLGVGAAVGSYREAGVRRNWEDAMLPEVAISELPQDGVERGFISAGALAGKLPPLIILRIPVAGEWVDDVGESERQHYYVCKRHALPLLHFLELSKILWRG